MRYVLTRNMSAQVGTRPVLPQWTMGYKHTEEELIFEIMVKYKGRVSCLSKECTRINANLGDFDRPYINQELIAVQPVSTPSVVTMREKIVVPVVWLHLRNLLIVKVLIIIRIILIRPMKDVIQHVNILNSHKNETYSVNDGRVKVTDTPSKHFCLTEIK